MTSTRYSRRVVVIGAPQTLTEVRVLGLAAFPLPEPFHAEPGVYRAELDPNTRTATIRMEDA